MSKKTSRPAWFKMFLHQKALIDSVPDETAGRALKAVFQYFDTGEAPELDPLAFAVFAAIKPYIDESFDDFKRTQEKNRANVQKRWNQKDTTETHSLPLDTTGTTGNQSLPHDTKNTEAEAEAEAEAEGECKADKPPRTRSPAQKRFVPPTVEQVAEYVKQRGSKVDPQGFIDFYEAKGWKIGKTPMKDWKAACRNSELWERWEKPRDTRNQVRTAADYDKGGVDFFGN